MMSFLELRAQRVSPLKSLVWLSNSGIQVKKKTTVIMFYVSKNKKRLCINTRSTLSSTHHLLFKMTEQHVFAIVSSESLFEQPGKTSNALRSKRTKICVKHSSAMPLCRSACVRRYVCFLSLFSNLFVLICLAA